MIKLLSLFSSLLLIVSLGFGQENRSFSGYGNNISNPEWGSTSTALSRVSSVSYLDQVQEINNIGLPIPRKVSNDLFSQNESFRNGNDLSDFVWLFGQFLDHDISHVPSDPSQTSALELPSDETFFDDNTRIDLSRSLQIAGTGENGIPRAYANEVSSFIDASMVYGSDIDRANWLRTFQGGTMKVSKSENISFIKGDLLPWNTISNEFSGSNIDFTAPAMDNVTAPGQLEKLFVCGDTRANENPLLIAIHTLFVREHNRLCQELSTQYPDWTDEQLYQRARKYVGAYIQSITYNEWLPAIGVNLPDYIGYSEERNPAVFNVFSAAAFRIGHTMISSEIIMVDDDGNELDENLTLANTYFRPQALLTGGGVDAYFKGMGTQVMQEMDCKMVDDLRNYRDGSIGLDLVASNIYRGRDRGLADFNTLRQDFGLPPLTSFDQLTDQQEDVRIISELYNGDINKIDAWVGMMAEEHISSDAIFGELVLNILSEQFRILRDGDRFYFENDDAFTANQKTQIQNTTLSEIIMRNTSISLMQPNVFQALPHEDIPVIELEELPLNTIVFPNPVIDQATVKIYSEIAQNLDYKLIDLFGQVIEDGNINLVEGSENYLVLDFDVTLSKGMYNLLIETTSGFRTIKIIK